MVKVGSILLLMMSLLTGCSFFEKKETQPRNEPGHVAAVLQPGVEVIAENLSIPWSIDKVNQTFYISERTGRIVKIENGKMERQRVNLKNPLAQAAEAGLLGFVLDPQFSTNQRAFAYYTYTNDKDKGQYNRVIVLRKHGTEWTEENTLLDKIRSAAFHHGGRIKVGPDQKLYITTGDATTPETAQKLNSLNGKILRMNLDGTVPKDNPSPNSYVYSYGHRNPQGLVWIGDNFYESEHGPSAHDEINRMKPGANYGWPLIMGTQKNTGMESPVFQSVDETWAPSGMVAYNGKLYVATLRGNAVREFDLGTKTTKPVITGLGRIRDLYIDGDYLYFVSNNTDGRGNPDKNDDKLYRVLLSDLK